MLPIVQVVRALSERPALEIREAIKSFATSCIELFGNDTSDCPVQHHFAPGTYAREIYMPSGTVIVGKVHRHAHVNVISAGAVVVLTEFGHEELVAPVTFVSKPGTQRLVVVLEDTVWTTVHATDSTDLAEIEKEVIAVTHDDIELQGEFTEVV